MRVNRLKVRTFVGSRVMASVIWDSEGILLVEILERCHSQFREICADIKVFKTMNLKGSSKQENESSTHPTVQIQHPTTPIYLAT
jgi:hypothetical protein